MEISVQRRFHAGNHGYDGINHGPLIKLLIHNTGPVFKPDDRGRCHHSFGMVQQITHRYASVIFVPLADYETRQRAVPKNVWQIQYRAEHATH